MRRIHEMPFGAAPDGAGGARFALWAPGARSVDVVLEGPSAPGSRSVAHGAGHSEPERSVALVPGDGGWYRAALPDVAPGTRYRYAIEGGQRVPDPASRFQPEGTSGPSELVDPAAFDWADDDWSGRPFEEAVFYELHVGAFTPRGDYAGVAERLDHLASLGVTALELMPLAECPGARNWGYDGVLPFAPASRYGRPEALKTLVAAAHARGLMVFLDVVYNHFGPEGNHLRAYAPGFFTTRYATPWGEAIDFESEASRPVRDFFVHNALYWLEEFHLDGLRLDAVHAIHDASTPHLLEELAARVRERLPRAHLVLENDANEARRLAREPDSRPRQYTAQWNDDLHHALHVMLTGERDGYYADYTDDAEGPVRHLARALAEGFAYQGEPSAHRGGAQRGEPSGMLSPTAFVGFLQNHDQVGNRALGERITQLAPPEAVAAATHVLLLAPAVPLLFMGEEWGAAQPFLFFCDFEGELARAVREGRRREFAHFSAFAGPEAARSEAAGPEAAGPEATARIPDPGAPETFAASRLAWEDLAKEPHRSILVRTRELLAVRRREIAPRLAGASTGGRWQILGRTGCRVEWVLGDGCRLVLLANLGPDAIPCRAEALAEHRVLAATPDALPAHLARGRLPAWSAASWLAEPE